MRINSQTIKAGPIDFEVLSQSAVEHLPGELRVMVQNMPDIDKMDGLIISRAENDTPLTLVIFCVEYFPYQNSVSFHSAIVSERKSYKATIALLHTYLLICKLIGIRRLISRHDQDHLLTLLMLLDLGFEVCEFSRMSRTHVVVKKTFDFDTINRFEVSHVDSIRRIYLGPRGLGKPDYLEDIEKLQPNTPSPLQSKIALNQLVSWLGLNAVDLPHELDELDRLCGTQPGIRTHRIGTGNQLIYLLENIQTKTSFILLPHSRQPRQLVLSVAKLLKKIDSKIAYTNKYDDRLRCVLFLAGFIIVSIRRDRVDESLWKWEKWDGEPK